MVPCAIILGMLAFPASGKCTGRSSVPRATLTGIVMDDLDAVPIDSALVFLSQTTLSSITDTSGCFIIENVPLAAYDLVIRANDYALTILTVCPTEPNPDTLSLYMGLQSHDESDLPNPSGSDRRQAGYFREFRRFLLGESDMAAQCHIENPDDIRVYLDREKNLKAEASVPILIINTGLGFKIECHLLDFHYYRRTGRLRFNAKTRFIPMHSDDLQEQRKWQENRLDAYMGSPRHFMRALCEGTSENEGYSVWHVPSPSNGNAFDNDKPVNPGQFLFPGDMPWEREVRFSETIKIVQSLEAGRMRDVAGFVFREPQTSWLSIRDEERILINMDGIIYNPSVMNLSGYWATKRLSHQLPLNTIFE